jgi:Cys-rich four helix bundle protein (predicted Tat secretion target)
MGAVLAAAATTGIGIAATDGALAAATGRKPPPFDLLVRPTTDLGVKAQECLSFCIYMLGQGMKDMAPCARNVNELLVLNTALQSLALQHGRQLTGLVLLAVSAAQACDSECRKFSQYAQCKACSDACVELIRACQQFRIEYAEFQRSIAK